MSADPASAPTPLSSRAALARAVASAAIVIMLAAAAVAADYHVAPAGDDSNPGSSALPFRTISRGVLYLKPGDTLRVKAGVYKESVAISVKASSDAPVRILAEQGAHLQAAGQDALAVSNSSHVSVEGLKITGAARAGIAITASDNVTVKAVACGDNGGSAVRASMSPHVTVDSCELYGSRTGHGLHFSAADYPSVLDCRVYDNAAGGILMSGEPREGGDGVISGAVIARNTIRNNGAEGGAAITLDGVERATVEKNVITDNFAGGILSRKGGAARAGASNTFSGNFISFEPAKGAFAISLADGSLRATVEGNIISIAAGPAIVVDEASSRRFRASHNLYDGASGEVTFSWKGQTLGFRQWQDATGQDSTSHLKVTVDTKPSP